MRYREFLKALEVFKSLPFHLTEEEQFRLLQIKRKIGWYGEENTKKKIRKFTKKRSYVRYRKLFCEECTSKENLTVHHMDCNHKNNKKDNLQTLCLDCHKRKHRRPDLSPHTP
jgi:hypothetical protein